MRTRGIGLLFGALVRGGRLVNVQSPGPSSTTCGRERDSRRDHREPGLVGVLRRAHALPGAQRLRAATGTPRCPGARLHRRRVCGREQLGALQRADRRPGARLGDAAVSLRAAARAAARRSPGSPTAASITWPGYRAARAARRCASTRIPGDGVRGATSARTCTSSASAAGRATGTLSRRVAHRPVRPRRACSVVDNHTPGAEGYLPPGGYPRARRAARGTTRPTPRRSRSPPTRATQASSSAGASAPASSSDADRGADYGEAEPSRDASAAPLPSGRTPRMALALRRRAARGARADRQRARQRGRPARAGDAAAARLPAAGRRTTTLKLTQTPRRFDSRGRPVRVTVSLAGFFAGEIPYRGLTLVRTALLA